MKFSINPNLQTEELLNEMLEKFGGSKIEVINILADRYLAQGKMIEQLQEELDEERRLRKSLLRNLENKMNVVYEIENTRLHYEDFPKMKSSDQEPNHILREAENHLEMKRNQEIFHHFEQRVND
ncbi:hypothetical protein JFI87_01620 [Enterococcus faecium]|uniref:hypothetical protein n=1 Tax=Enterococcus TaxID=1350 RepID=UPI000CF0DBBD|nr:hypothetical protein [Enterococcus faecium]MBG7803719.1 hypothetical protein [Enterococcus faecium]MBG7953201.1 hypothetical protein [Enterococcus faecium]MBG8283118.1 hypothetical protein [Enterococcus faecium]MBH0946026.1 hypothetical protein [Enterococcus faecium]MBJ1178757.1 hypothetical protein [Enterococcus faecium]